MKSGHGGRETGRANNRRHDEVGGPCSGIHQRRFSGAGLDACSLKKRAKLLGHALVGYRRILRPQGDCEGGQLLGVTIRRQSHSLKTIRVEGEKVASVLPDRASRSEHAHALYLTRAARLSAGGIPVIFHFSSTLAPCF